MSQQTRIASETANLIVDNNNHFVNMN